MGSKIHYFLSNPTEITDMLYPCLTAKENKQQSEAPYQRIYRRIRMNNNNSQVSIFLNNHTAFYILFLKKDFIHLFLERGGEGERERNINVWLCLVYLLLGTWSKTQACTLTEWNLWPLLCRPTLNPLSHTSQGTFF